MTDYDVIVVGLGPAGAIAAYELSRRGHRVLAVDRSPLPRGKVCGGALTIRAASLIPFDFSDEIEQIIHGIRFNFCGRDPFIIETTEPVAYTVSRDRFDYLLASKAEAVGAILCDETEIVEWKEDGVEIVVQSRHETWRCRYLIGADGLNGLIRRSRESPSDGGAVGVESEIPYQEVERGDHSLIQVDLGSAPDGYGWLLPKRNHHATGVSGAERKVKSAGELYGQFIENQGILKEASGQQVSVYHRIPSREGTPLHEGNVLWVGDAAGLIDPLSGDGLYYALLTGLIAAEVISNSFLEGASLSAYTARVRAETTEEFRVAHRFARLFYRWPETSYRFLQSHKWVAELYFEILRGRERYDHIWPIVKKEWLRFAWRYWLTPRGARTQPLKQTTLGAFWRKGSELLFNRDRTARYLHSERRAHKRA